MYLGLLFLQVDLDNLDGILGIHKSIVIHISSLDNDAKNKNI